MEKIKVCKKCGISYPATTEYFYKHSETKDGLFSSCKICEINKGKDRYLKNPEHAKALSKERKLKNKQQIKEKNHEYYINNKEKIRIANKKWIKNNSDRFKALNKKWITENKDRFKELNKSWIELNKDKVRLIAAKSVQKRIATKNMLPNDFNIAEWENCMLHFHNKCAYCGCEKKLSQDHFIPLSKGGEYTKNNIVPACTKCNSSKNNKSFFDWYPKQPFYSKRREQRILKYLNYDIKTKIQQMALTI